MAELFSLSDNDPQAGLILGAALAAMSGIALAVARRHSLRGGELFIYWLGSALAGTFAMWLNYAFYYNNPYGALILGAVLAAMSGLVLRVWWAKTKESESPL